MDIEPEMSEPTPTRRDLLLKGTVAAAVAAVAGSAISSRANAADGDSIRVGFTTTGSGSATTTLNGGTTFRVTNGGTAGAASVYGTSTGSTSLYGIRGDRTGSTAGGAGVYGTATGTDQAGVWGEATGSTGGVGVYGEASGTVSYGVYGYHSGSFSDGVGVRGESNGGIGVVGDGSTYDIVAAGSGKVRISAVASPAATANGAVGTIARDSAGTLWYCVATNQWRQIAGTATAGAFVPVTPFRVYESRKIVNAANDGPLSQGTNRIVDCSDAISPITGAVTSAGALPAAARAIAYTVTITNTTGGGYVAVLPGTATEVTASTINWDGPVTLANSSVVGITNRQIKVFCGGGPGTSTDFIIDVVGYYL